MPIHATPEVRAGICVFRPRGTCTLVETVDFIADCVAHCRQRALGKLVINCTGLEGPPMPSLVDRFLAVEDWARAANGMVVVALVVHARFIHSDKFGSKVAADLGLGYEMFADEAEAFAWIEKAA